MQHGSWRVGQERLDASARDVLEVSGRAGEGAGSTCGACESIDRAVRLVPDLGTCSLDVCAAIGCVVELVGPHGSAGSLLSNEPLGVPLGLVVVVLRVVECDGGHRVHLGAEQ